MISGSSAYTQPNVPSRYDDFNSDNSTSGDFFTTCYSNRNNCVLAQATNRLPNNLFQIRNSHPITPDTSVSDTELLDAIQLLADTNQESSDIVIKSSDIVIKSPEDIRKSVDNIFVDLTNVVRRKCRDGTFNQLIYEHTLEQFTQNLTEPPNKISLILRQVLGEPIIVTIPIFLVPKISVAITRYIMIQLHQALVMNKGNATQIILEANGFITEYFATLQDQASSEHIVELKFFLESSLNQFMQSSGLIQHRPNQSVNAPNNTPPRWC